jgi:ribosomal protein L32
MQTEISNELTMLISSKNTGKSILTKVMEGIVEHIDDMSFEQIVKLSKAISNNQHCSQKLFEKETSKISLVIKCPCCGANKFHNTSCMYCG